MQEDERKICSFLNTPYSPRHRKVLMRESPPDETGGRDTVSIAASGLHRARRSDAVVAAMVRNMSITNPETVPDVLGYLALYAVWLLGMYAVGQSGWL
jgi:hypothetical protein